MNSKRNTNIELLRIISMYLIVCHHIVVHGFEQKVNYSIALESKIFLDFLSIGGKLGVDIFIIIFGYFMVNQTFNQKKWLSIFNQMFFYSILFFICNLIFKWSSINLKTLLASILPFTYMGYWFITTYLMLYVFTPYINKMIVNLKHNEFKKLLGISIFFSLVLPSIFPKSFDGLFGNLIVFFTLYFTGAYIQLYGLENIKQLKKYTIGSLLFLIISILMLNYIAYFCNSDIIWSHANYFAILNNKSIFIYILASSLFIFTINMKFRNIKVINQISSLTLGVYLIHDNIFVRKLLWDKIIPVSQIANHSLFNLIFEVFIYTIVVFIFCLLIEYCRQYSIKIFNTIKCHKSLK